jgi:hypothetical protein
MRFTLKLLARLSVVVWLALLAAASSAQEPADYGTKRAGGLEITLLAAPPLTAEQMQKMMPGMGGMPGMPSMGGMPGMGKMEGMQGQPTHWIGVFVRDAKTDAAMQNLDITLTAQKGDVSRTVTLMPMPGSYGANISLPEKGQYHMRVRVNRPEQPVQVDFEFVYQ